VTSPEAVQVNCKGRAFPCRIEITDPLARGFEAFVSCSESIPTLDKCDASYQNTNLIIIEEPKSGRKVYRDAIYLTLVPDRPETELTILAQFKDSRAVVKKQVLAKENKEMKVKPISKQK
jgi:hypothetical protein